MVFPVSCVAISDMGEMSLKLFGGAAEAHCSDQACVVHSNTRMSIVVMLTVHLRAGSTSHHPQEQASLFYSLPKSRKLRFGVVKGFS